MLAGPSRGAQARVLFAEFEGAYESPFMHNKVLDSHECDSCRRCMSVGSPLIVVPLTWRLGGSLHCESTSKKLPPLVINSFGDSQLVASQHFH